MKITIAPQHGPQTSFLNSQADLAIFGGSAGSGKSHALLIDPLRHIYNPEFGAVIFRRTTNQIRNEGSLWDKAVSLYSPFNCTFRESGLEVIFPTEMRIKFAHMEHEKNKYDWQGSEIGMIGFDELTHFTESQFFYMLSRNRSTSGITPYVRATCNADADSWVRSLIAWYLDNNSGYPIASRSGVLRYFVRINDQIHWADSPEELIRTFGDGVIPKSLTFIPAKLEDNPIFMAKDPAYRANLMALPLVERMRLLEGNWNVKATAGTVYKREWFEIVDAAPAQAIKTVRYWDRASSEPSPAYPDPDYTAGLKVMRDKQGVFYILDLFHDRISSMKVENAIRNTTIQDGTKVSPWLEVDPGQAGVFEKSHYSKLLAGYDVNFNRPTKGKVERSNIASSQAEAGNIKLVRAPWNETFLKEVDSFPDGAHLDIADTLSGAIQALTGVGVGEFTTDMTESRNTSVVDDSQSTNIEW